ncbi:MAG: hypothetical protein AAGJ18_27900 [Bacteroidota bacterium]
MQFAIDSINNDEGWIYLNGVELPKHSSKKDTRKKVRTYFKKLFAEAIILE